jgi:hypothetical protein
MNQGPRFLTFSKSPSDISRASLEEKLRSGEALDWCECAGTLIPLDDMNAALKNRRVVTIREVMPGEQPDFIQKKDQLVTAGMVIDAAEKFSYTVDPPIPLRSGAGYVLTQR